MRDCYCHGMLWFPLKFSLLALFSLSCSPLIATPQVLNVPNAGAISNEIRQTTIEPLNAPEETDIKLPQLNKPTPPEGDSRLNALPCTGLGLKAMSRYFSLVLPLTIRIYRR